MGSGKNIYFYSSSREAQMKFFVLVLTFGISIFASLYDYKSCYITILIQAINNTYDFYPFSDNTKNETLIRRESIAIVLCSIVATIVSIIAFLELYDVMQCIWFKLLAVFLVTLPLIFVYNDYRLNVSKENEHEEKE